MDKKVIRKYMTTIVDSSHPKSAVIFRMQTLPVTNGEWLPCPYLKY